MLPITFLGEIETTIDSPIFSKICAPGKLDLSDPQMSHGQKTLLLSIIYCLFNRDSYNGVI